ncbi:Piso0_001624 [Millerozyma farinosa CBS 7064]|uniref:Piso0_001624 protein n=1 Tax=Pichia sorbitophila (strain ATCC MYA-4447 / BCRC 22081 / CBS 7064 / NBRC 10061 / NRRL Y-12695) TaxID=559304 RepID=G8YNN4_PICSO|nr:Piso0_001624 [Millerozyma farinosa CBS 7064]
MFKHNHSILTSFDIQLNSPYKDTVLVKGNEFECEPILFEGDVKFKLPQDTHVKRICLNLVGELTVEYLERSADGYIVEPIYDKLCFMRVEWKNLLVNSDAEIRLGNYGDKFVPPHKLEEYLRKRSRNNSRSTLNTDHSDRNRQNSSGDLGSSIPGASRDSRHSAEKPKYTRSSSQPLLSLSHNMHNKHIPLLHLSDNGSEGTPFHHIMPSSNHSFLLKNGDYTLPFKCYLPTNTPETVEGLKYGNVLYRLECSIERGRFEKTLHKDKYVRIFRTLHPRNLNATDNIDIDNSWPDKIQYNVSLKKKGIALGSTIPVNLLLFPMVKGLRLRSMTGCLVQYFSVSHSEGTSPKYEEVVGKQKMTLPDPKTFAPDRWVVKSHYKVPDSLDQITQSCQLKNDIVEVKHRLRISIQLKNKDGHVSELRANLPVHVYISPKHAIKCRNFQPSGHGYLTCDDFAKYDTLFDKDENRQTAISSRNPSMVGLDVTAPLDASDGDEEEDDDESLDDDPAPPLYQQHVFDKLFDMSSPCSPYDQLTNSNSNSMGNINSYFDIPRSYRGQSVDASQLTSPVGTSPSDRNTVDKVPSYDQALDQSQSYTDPVPSYESSNPGTSNSSLSSSAPTSNTTTVFPNQYSSSKGPKEIKSGSPSWSKFHLNVPRANPKHRKTQSLHTSAAGSPLHSPSGSFTNLDQMNGANRAATPNARSTSFAKVFHKKK